MNGNNTDDTSTIFSTGGHAAWTLGSDDEPTGIAPTVAAAGVAWSDDLPWATTPQRSWTPVYVAVAAVVAGALILLGAVGVGGWLARAGQTARTATVSSATPSPSSVPPGAIPQIAAPPVQTSTVTVSAQPAPTVTRTVTVQAAPPSVSVPSTDELFLATLRARQIVIYDPQKVVRGAHYVCSELAAGKTRSQIFAESKPLNPALTDIGLRDVINASVAFYCPEYQ
jgi:Protein of unknown function (DUF732)